MVKFFIEITTVSIYYPGDSCYHYGVRYANGESFKDDCNTCRCTNGIAECTRMGCRKTVYYMIENNAQFISIKTNIFAAKIPWQNLIWSLRLSVLPVDIFSSSEVCRQLISSKRNCILSGHKMFRNQHTLKHFIDCLH